MVYRRSRFSAFCWSLAVLTTTLECLSQEVQLSSNQEQQKSDQSSGYQTSRLHFSLPTNQQVSKALHQLPWSIPEPISPIREPANIPAIINQDEARYLEQYMKNQLGETPPLNLASINHRATSRGEQQVIPNRRVTVENQSNRVYYEPSKQSVMQDRSDPNPKRHDEVDPTARKGRVEDAVLFKVNQAAGKLHRQPIGPLTSKKLLNPLESFARNCITDSKVHAARCEDHLIRRLNQDATEGRTVVDVERRVCCALFWHNDCIDGIILRTCPDSSPAAAEFLQGSRKIDLTISCQGFNRDGCNGAPGSSALSRITVILTTIMILVATRYLYSF